MIRVLVLLISCFIVAPTAHAGTIASFGKMLAFEKDNDGRSQVQRDLFQFRAGYRYSLADLFLEYAAYEASEGNEMVEISRTHTEVALWARKEFFSRWSVAANLGAGAGFQYDRVQTRLAEATTMDQGAPQGLMALSLGLEAKLVREFSLLLESRVAASLAAPEQPTLGIGLSAQIHF